MDAESKFKTKTGYCHILKDKIVLTRDGIVGNTTKIVSGNKIYRPLIGYGMVSCIVFYNGYQDFRNENWTFFAIYIGIGVFLMYSILKSLKLSTTPIIFRDKIKNVEFKSAKKRLTRSYFRVDFVQENGKIKSRLIMLPGSLNDGIEETKKALEIMKKEGFIA